MRNRLFALPLLFFLITCSDDDGPQHNYPDQAVVAPLEDLAQVDGVRILDGGYGSSMASDPLSKKHFYLLTDRGPNFDTGTKGEKGFALPRFSPHIARFRLEGEALVLVDDITLKAPSGDALTGLPNPLGAGGTGEVPKDLKGNVLEYDPQGLDSEGLVALKDGTFWISDEYGPHLLHIDKEGKTIERINPFGSDRAIPKVFGKRRPNRGMEGLTISPDGSTLVGIMQSALYNPDNSVKSTARLTRILSFDIATAESREYAYIQEVPGNSNSEITALSATEFLVIERDGAFYPEAKYKRVYKIDISEATDISSAGNTENGMLLQGRTLEQLSEGELLAQGIRPVSKTLVVDMLEYNAYPHDKMEGIVILDKNVLAIVNDDDFSIRPGKQPGKIAQKTLSNGKIDRATVYFVRLEKALY